MADKGILLRVPEWMAEAMADAADTNGWSRNRWMVDALETELRTQGYPPPGETVAERDLRVAR